MGRKRSYMLAFEGILPSLERRYKETESSYQKERLEEYMALKPCPLCKGARLKDTSLAVTVGDINISELTRKSVTSAIEFVDQLQLTDTERAIGARILKEIRERLSFLANVGVGYLALDRGAASLSGGEAQRIRLATQIGSSLMGVLYILDEPSHRTAPARQRPAPGDAGAAAQSRQHRDRGRARRGHHPGGRPHRRHGAGSR